MLKSILLSIGLLYLGVQELRATHQTFSDVERKMPPLHSSDSLRLVWTCSAPFEKVESVVYDATRACIYVSNGKAYGLGQDGFISKISLDGEVIDLKWIKDLNRPTGMAMYGDRLYVADVNALLIIDPSTASVLKRLEVPINYGINDVAVSEEGTVFVTASAIHAILRLVEQELEMWVQDEALMQWANGIQARPGALLVGGEHLVRIDLDSKDIAVMATEPKVRDFEGVAQMEAKTILASTVENSALYLIQGGKSSLLLQPEGYFGDLEYLPKAKRLIIAEGNHQQKTYSVRCYALW